MRRALFGVLSVAVGVAGCSHLYEPRVVTVAREAPAGATAPVDAAAAKKAFCAVYAQEVRKVESATDRFIAASAGDELHPDTNWDDPDHWFSDMADDASIIFGYAADAVEPQIASSLPGDLRVKAQALVASMRTLQDLYARHSAVRDLKAESTEQYGPTANDIDKLCGLA
ncbi:MAG: hypothetical protein ACRC20_06750 [Segniliparus sp.]|uniref:hypothetical protein n=1 Tax=Segniliparus sp. TaxID=2804064 RepID=UPI003F37C77A